MSIGSRPTKMRTDGEGGKLSMSPARKARAGAPPHRSGHRAKAAGRPVRRARACCGPCAHYAGSSAPPQGRAGSCAEQDSREPISGGARRVRGRASTAEYPCYGRNRHRAAGSRRTRSEVPGCRYGVPWGRIGSAFMQRAPIPRTRPDGCTGLVHV